MDVDRFWQLIEQARVQAGPAADQAVRDYDDPDDDPDRDYWDFDDVDVQSALGLSDADFDDSADGAVGDGERLAGDDLSDEDDDDLEDLDEDFDDEDFDDEDDELIDPVAVALVDVLADLPAAEIAAFDNLFDLVREQADRDDVANAATLIEHGFLGDDSFDDFRAGLVALGRATYEAALRDPDTLADHPLVREIAEANDPRWLGREDLIYAASHAYARVTGEDAMSFYDFAEKVGEDAPPAWQPAPREPDDSHWEITDEAETRRRLPKLSQVFYERSMRNRERALAKLGLND